MSSVGISDIADILLYKIFNRCSLSDRLLALELVNSRWRQLSMQATSSPDRTISDKLERLSTHEFEKTTISFHFALQASKVGKGSQEANAFLLRLLEHVLPRLGARLKAVELLPKSADADVPDLETRANEEADEPVTMGFPISKVAVELLLRYCPNLEEIDFGQTYCDGETGQLLKRFPNLRALIFRVAGEKCEFNLPNLLPNLNLITLGTAQGSITCANPAQLRSLRLYNGSHPHFENIKSQLHAHFPNLEELVRGQSRVYGANDDSDSDEDDRHYLESMCKLKKLKRFDDMTSVVKSEQDMDQLLKSCPNFTSVRVTAMFEGDFNNVLKANWIRRIRTVCLCDLKIDLSCLRSIFSIGTLNVLRLNCFVEKDIEDAAAEASACVEGKDTKLIGQCLASLKHLVVRVRSNQKHVWANRLTKEVLWSERVQLRSFKGSYICERDTLETFGAYALAGKSRHMTDLHLRTNSSNLLPIFDHSKDWPKLRRLELTVVPSLSNSPPLKYFEPLLRTETPKLMYLTTKYAGSLLEIASSSVSPENGAFPFYLVASQWPQLKVWHTLNVAQQGEAYEILRQLTSHPSLEQASIDGLNFRWNPSSINKAVRIGRETLHVRNGRRMHALTLTLLCNGERIFDQHGTFIGQRGTGEPNGVANARFHIASCSEMLNVHMC